MNNKIKELLEEIRNWMIENDYECGSEGSGIYNEISQILKKEQFNAKEKALQLCYEIEKLPASEQQTKVSVLAAELHTKL